MQECKINTEIEAFKGQPVSPLDGSHVLVIIQSVQSSTRTSAATTMTQMRSLICVGGCCYFVCIYLRGN